MTGINRALPAPFAGDQDGDGILAERMSLLGLTQLPSRPVETTLDRLRAACPRRALSWRDAEQIAERQAGRLRRELGLDGQLKLPTDALRDLPFLTVAYRDGFPTSGMAMSTPRGWVVVIKGDEPKVRQRFSLAHEIKHIIDDERMHELPAGLYPATPLYSAEARAERVADHFAAALLMPKTSLRRDWSDGLQELGVLARRYDVSRAAMEVRLRQLRLLEPTPRCAAPMNTAAEGGK